MAITLPTANGPDNETDLMSAFHSGRVATSAHRRTSSLNVFLV
jgi:hypothetical protein